MFILIILFSTASVSTPVTSIQTEFKDFQSCEYARKHIVDSVAITAKAHDDGRIIAKILSHGCYKR